MRLDPKVMRAAWNSMCEISRHKPLNHVSVQWEWKIAANSLGCYKKGSHLCSLLCILTMSATAVQYETTFTEIIVSITRPPLPPRERLSNCIADLFSWMQPGKYTHLLPTCFLSIFASWALLHLPQISWAALAVSPPLPVVPLVPRWGREARTEHQAQLPPSCSPSWGWGRESRTGHQAHLPPSCPWWAQNPPTLWGYKPDHAPLL